MRLTNLCLIVLVGGLGAIWPGDARAADPGLQLRYNSGLFRVLIVPGHDASSPGAVYRGLKESDLTLKLASHLYAHLNDDHHFQVYSVRDLSTGDYQSGFSQYFEAAVAEVNAFRDRQHSEFERSLGQGRLTPAVGVAHNFAREDVAYRLHAVNKWANDNAIDLVLHLHFNDYGQRPAGLAGQHSGFAIYVPERQFSNHPLSWQLAAAIFTPLSQLVATSTLPLESAGIVEDQELIAIGAYNSRTGPSLLLEYGYIYESALASPALREIYLPELALQTYRGLRGYFSAAADLPTTTLLPHHFGVDLTSGLKESPETLRLQKALQTEGLYPPAGRKLTDCPLSGNFGPCTLAAVTAFQSRYNIPATGLVGPLTRGKLNSLYGN